MEGAAVARILVVEDDPDVRALGENVLTEAGHGVVAVAGMQEALREIRGDGFELVITDGLLSDGNGVEIAEAAEQHGLRAVIITGYPRDLPQDRLNRFPWRAKPIRPSELVALVDNQLKPGLSS